MTNSLSLPGNLELASLGRRALAALVDAVVGAGIWYPFFHTWGRYNSETGGYEVTGAPALALFALTAAYWILTEWIFSGTVGKLACGIRVVSIDGRKCSLSQSLKRNLLRLVDFFPFYLVGFLVAHFSPLSQRLGDQWAETGVILHRPRESTKFTGET